MATAHPSFQQPRSMAGIGVSLAVHALLIGVWQLSRPVAVRDDGEPLRVQVLRLLPAPARADSIPPEPPTAPARDTRVGPAARPPAQTEPRHTPQAAADTIPLPAAPDAEAPPAPSMSSADLLRAARAAAGAADRAVRTENPRRGIHAPVETAQMKLEKGIAHAADMAPNKWYQAPKTQEIIDPGQYGRRRYRVITAGGTYCVTYESNHAPDGIDTMRNGIKPKFTNCDEDEQPATRQKWN